MAMAVAPLGAKTCKGTSGTVVPELALDDTKAALDRTVEVRLGDVDGAVQGRRGVVIPVRSWEDYLALATTEIREYGSSSIQVMRRLKAMLEELLDEVPPERQDAVRDELRRLAYTVDQSFTGSADFDRAHVADPQGMGGAHQ